MLRRKRLASGILAIASLSLWTRTATAQSVVQQPSFYQFGVNTSVLVPDSGAAKLGGYNRAASGSSSRRLGALGMPGVRRGNRTTSTGAAAGGATATAQIHDLQAMDAALLQTPARKPSRTTSRFQETSTLQQGPISSLAAIRNAQAAEQVAQDAQRNSAVTDLLQRARNAERNGKSSLARTYYRMVARQSTGAVREDALAQLRRSAAQSATVDGAQRDRLGSTPRQPAR